MDKVSKNDLQNYVRKLKPKDGDIIVFDIRYVSPEHAKYAFEAIKKDHKHLVGILLDNMDGIGIITLPRKEN